MRVFFLPKVALLLLWAAGFVLVSQAQPIKKRCYHAFSLSKVPDTILQSYGLKNGLLVNKVISSGTAAAAGMQANDVLVKINQESVSSVADVRGKKLAYIRVGDPVVYSIYRNNQRLLLKATAIGKPDQQSPGIEYQYQSIPFRGGLLRGVISKPTVAAGGHLPAILLVQGYTCGEMVDIDSVHPYRRLADGLTRAGYLVLRVEKPGVGDCVNTPDCGNIDFITEVEAFEQALLYLKFYQQTDTSQVFIWGHSLGGIIAPALTSKQHWVKGTIVYGTLNSIWGEYLLHMTRVQSEGFGMPPVEVDKTTRAVRKILYEIYTLKKTPAQFVKEHPAYRSVLVDQFMWQPGSDKLYTRSAKFNQQLDDIDVNVWWQATACKVLGIYGEADIEALNPAGTISLINTVNFYHPGNGTYHFLPGTDHSFAKVGTIEDGYKTKADPAYSNIMIQKFNPDIINVSVNWLNQITGKRTVEKNTVSTASWKKLATEKYPGKQDDICFINPMKGWYVNGGGNIYKTNDGGNTWIKSFQQPGTFFRCIAFIDSMNGFAGNVGTDYFPNVKDTIPLYQTNDGGATWKPVLYDGPYVKGLCAIDIVKEQYINHGQIDYRYHIYAVGRVGSPANIMVSHDGGQHFQSWSMQEDGKMLFDIKMFNKNEGFVCAASNEAIEQSNALVLYTSNGGKSWEKRYQSNRPFETTWKMSFPNRDTGYVTIQQYNPDKAISKQQVAKTTDGGRTWTELPLCDDYNAREFGIGFLDAQHGFVGTLTSGYETTDGGRTWHKVDMGRACNKIRFYADAEGKPYGYAIGVDVLKFVTE